MLAKLGGPTEKAVKTGIFHLQSWLEGQESFALAQGPRTQFTLGLISGEKFRRMPGLQISSLSQPISHCEEALSTCPLPTLDKSGQDEHGKGA